MPSSPKRLGTIRIPSGLVRRLSAIVEPMTTRSLNRRVTMVVILVVGLLVPALASDGPGPSVTFALEMDGGIVVPVLINGAGPFRFRLDTGASRTVVTTKLAGQLSLPAAGVSRLVTPTGASQSALVAIGAVEIGCRSPAAVTALALPGAALDDARGIDGLIGQDVLAWRAYTIDYERRRLVCDSRVGAPIAGRQLPLAFSDGRALVTFPLADGRTLHLVPDSGADRLVLFSGSPSGLPLVTPLDIVRLRSVTGQQIARRVIVHGFGVGPAGGQGLEGLVVEPPPGGNALGDGLLPLSLFARVTFNGAEGQIVLENRR